MKRFSIIILLTLISFLTFAQKEKSIWEVTNIVELTTEQTIHEKTTKNGNTKYYLLIENVEITVSETNAKKYKNKEINLVIVEWKDQHNNYRYTTRQKKQQKQNIKLNLNSL